VFGSKLDGMEREIFIKIITRTGERGVSRGEELRANGLSGWFFVVITSFGQIKFRAIEVFCKIYRFHLAGFYFKSSGS
jgi:hypothetical protein